MPIVRRLFHIIPYIPGNPTQTHIVRNSVPRSRTAADVGCRSNGIKPLCQADNETTQAPARREMCIEYYSVYEVSVCNCTLHRCGIACRRILLLNTLPKNRRWFSATVWRWYFLCMFAHLPGSREILFLVLRAARVSMRWAEPGRVVYWIWHACQTHLHFKEGLMYTLICI